MKGACENIMAVKFINISRNEFLSKTPLFKMIHSKYAWNTLGASSNLYFSNPSKWEDAFEKRFVETKYYKGAGISVPYPLKDKVYCCCFSLERVMEPQWVMYSHGASTENVMKLTVNKEKLLSELENQQAFDVYIGKVEYQPTGMITQSLAKNPFLKGFNLNNQDSLVRLLFLKRNAYMYENELRIVLVEKDETGRDKDGMSFNFKCPATDLVQEITLGPKWNDNNLKDALSAPLGKVINGLCGYGFTPITDKRGHRYLRVKQSRLYNYQVPKFIRI